MDRDRDKKSGRVGKDEDGDLIERARERNVISSSCLYLVSISLLKCSRHQSMNLSDC